MIPLYGHDSEATAYLVDDYPYGFRLRCQMKVWLEKRNGKGYRMVSQTSNPKKPGMWNKPKASTYCAVAGNLFLDGENHIHWVGVSGYEDSVKLKKFLADFPENPEKDMIGKLIAYREKKEANPSPTPEWVIKETDPI